MTATFTASSTATLGAANVTITGDLGLDHRTTTVALTVTGGGDGGTVTATPVGVDQQPVVQRAATAAREHRHADGADGHGRGAAHDGRELLRQYNTVGGQIAQTNSSTTAAITYTFTLAAGQTLPASTGRTFAMQTSGNGTAHPTAGDTYTVTYTSGGTTGHDVPATSENAGHARHRVPATGDAPRTGAVPRFSVSGCQTQIVGAAHVRAQRRRAR